MKRFDWQRYCLPCKNWCCRCENPFASGAELKKLKIEKISSKEDGSCVFLDRSNACVKYALRPFECRIFPFDILEIDGRLAWVVWENCPAVAKLDVYEIVSSFEKSLKKKWSLVYVRKYVDYHRLNQPKKYSGIKFRKVRDIDWS
jgi:hypothetical protein